MENTGRKILYVGDDKNLVANLDENYILRHETNPSTAIDRIKRKAYYDIALIDLSIPIWNGEDIIQVISERSPRTIIFTISDSYSIVAERKGVRKNFSMPIRKDLFIKNIEDSLKTTSS